MTEETRNTHGGKRIGAGRKPSENSKVQTALKLDKDLYDAFKSEKFQALTMNRGQYINQAIREKMLRDGYLHDKE
jgi:uncharacterized protein (DUF4415 family)